MNIITEGGSEVDVAPYAVGTPNATKDVYNHVKPGRKRANFFRFTLPRLTKAVLMGVIALIGVCAAIVATSNNLPFPHSDAALWLISAAAAIYLVIAAVTFVWNGAWLGLAATWNLMMIASLAYFLLNWAVPSGSSWCGPILRHSRTREKN